MREIHFQIRGQAALCAAKTSRTRSGAVTPGHNLKDLPQQGVPRALLIQNARNVNEQNFSRIRNDAVEAGSARASRAVLRRPRGIQEGDAVLHARKIQPSLIRQSINPL